MTAPPDHAAPPPLLRDDEPSAFSLINGHGPAPIILVCDHASRRVPGRLGLLGLDEAVFEHHVAWDIGAAAVTEKLAERLDCVAVLAGYSRLVIDLNRPPGDPASVPEVSDGIPIPGNTGLSEAEIVERQDALFWPYHHAITERIAHVWRTGGVPPVLVSIHSFTPGMRTCAKPRPWHIGVMYNRDERLARPMIENLGREPGVVVGDNEPYSGRQVGFTPERHAAAAGLSHMALEIRQDQIADAAGQERWARILFDALAFVLVDSRLHRVENF